jgi:hypothetical protein
VANKGLIHATLTENSNVLMPRDLKEVTR